MNKLTAFFESPSNRTGVAAILSLIPGALAQLLAHNPALSSAVTVFCFGLAKILQPDNTASIATTAATSVVNASATVHGDALSAPAVKVTT